LPGAVLTRVAASHLRVGTFEYFAARDDREALETLTAYALARHYPQATEPGASVREQALALLASVAEAQASLIARWLGVGFVHGVMNTDNSSISGETLDYGPCAFLDEYNPQKTFSSIDRGGRYAFGNQPRIGQWNLARLAETILPLISADEKEAARLATVQIERFPVLFDAAHATVFRTKLGLLTEEESDPALAAELLRALSANHVDYTVFFRALCDAAEDPATDARVARLFRTPEVFHSFAANWRRRLEQESTPPGERARQMRLANPAFIPRNHRIEQAIVAGVAGDYQPFETLALLLARPYVDQPDLAHYAEPPLAEERVQATFCGT
jgi:uncharacterized protein YdiU (UPF0061 family)